MKPKKIVLPNGLRLLLVAQPSSVAATTLLLVEAGSEYETRHTSGISHFLEHMVFKGTSKRPKPGIIATELASLGAQSNAFTSQEYTGYWAKVESSKILHALEIVADMYLDPLFNPEEINRERGVVIEEINLYEDTPARRVHDLFSELLYGDQPAGWDVAGRKEIIRRLTRDDFIAYRRLHYLPKGTVVVVAGALDKEQVIWAVRSLFGRLKPGVPRAKLPTRESQARPRLIVKFKDSDQSHLILGVRAFDLFDKRRYALALLADILGGGMSSRLFIRVREEMGAAYYVRGSPRRSRKLTSASRPEEITTAKKRPRRI